jgi:hypothetical protein
MHSLARGWEEVGDLSGYADAALNIEATSRPNSADAEGLSLAERKSRLSIGKLAAYADAERKKEQEKVPSKAAGGADGATDSVNANLILSSRLLLVEAQEDLARVRRGREREREGEREGERGRERERGGERGKADRQTIAPADA